MERITIVGMGLIGTSLGMALKNGGTRAQIVGFDIERGVASKAKKRGGLDIVASNLEEAVEGARLVVLATPIPVMKELLSFLSTRLADGCVVTDVGGTKANVIQWADELLPSNVNFVGGHPMAGSERSGPEAGSEALFRGVLYPICPSTKAHPDATKTVADMVEAIGAKPYFMDPYEHDTYVAGVSHLPFLLSVSLVATTSKSPSWREMHKVAASGYRDISRLASGDPLMHLGVCETNRDNIVHWLDECIKQLYETRNMIKSGEMAKVHQLLVNAQDARARWVAGVEPGAAPMVEVSAKDVMNNMFVGNYVGKKVGSLRSDQQDQTHSQQKTKDQKR
ncbi:MAG: prephenate dehydrogenase/arogenate dehydrogenase family protein [Dehalococcoidia bacterium]|nr:prephenate dehydrogenase/arogenate dehydrogenase family protein [Dehalococcoidia bacterium]